ncbi:MAG: hypothetical protein H0W48_00470 [Methylibium sp.]|nr:hypothetical protein [Methylibium sp.]
MKHHRPTVVEKIQAQQQAPTPIQMHDIHNVLMAARLALAQFKGADLVNIAQSIAALDAILAAHAQKPADASGDHVPEAK